MYISMKLNHYVSITCCVFKPTPLTHAHQCKHHSTYFVVVFKQGIKYVVYSPIFILTFPQFTISVHAALNDDIISTLCLRHQLLADQVSQTI